MRRRRKRKRRTFQGHVESNVDVVVVAGGVGERMLDCTLNLKNYHYNNTQFIG